tara:strand:- start:45 stop:740 length:696 start_codon:yes stop_codon:yes gene_type:complete
MAEFIGIVGEPATGKSTSYGQFPTIRIKGLDPKETIIINVTGKPLAFKGWKKLYDPNKAIKDGGNYIASYDWDKITKVIEFIDKNRPEIKNIVLEDAQYVMAFEFMDRANEAGYKKFADIGVHFNKIRQAISSARENLQVFALWHPDIDNEGNMSMKTAGKMIKDYLNPEGLFTVILYSTVTRENNTANYKFVTNNDGKFPARSPIGMFEEEYIPNDLGFVREKINEYYNG